MLAGPLRGTVSCPSRQRDALGSPIGTGWPVTMCTLPRCHSSKCRPAAPVRSRICCVWSGPAARVMAPDDRPSASPPLWCPSRGPLPHQGLEDLHRDLAQPAQSDDQGVPAAAGQFLFLDPCGSAARRGADAADHSDGYRRGAAGSEWPRLAFTCPARDDCRIRPHWSDLLHWCSGLDSLRRRRFAAACCSPASQHPGRLCAQHSEWRR